jgi:hypothetical protein
VLRELGNLLGEEQLHLKVNGLELFTGAEEEAVGVVERN